MANRFTQFYFEDLPTARDAFIEEMTHIARIVMGDLHDLAAQQIAELCFFLRQHAPPAASGRGATLVTFRSVVRLLDCAYRLRTDSMTICDAVWASLNLTFLPMIPSVKVSACQASPQHRSRDGPCCIYRTTLPPLSLRVRGGGRYGYPCTTPRRPAVCRRSLL